VTGDWIERIKERVQGDGDAPQDTGVAASRDTGGVENDAYPDQQSTGGTTPDATYVGRIAGDDVGYAGETGAEARAEADRLGQDPEGSDQQ
jgi:hypothetical protein